MKDLTDLPPPKRRQQARARFAWFVGGSVLNYLLILLPFKWLRAHTGLPLLAISACSIAVGATFFFIWNYTINFRGDSRKRDALPRYLGAVLLMSALSSGLLTVLKQHDSHHAFSLLGHALLPPSLPAKCLMRRKRCSTRFVPSTKLPTDRGSLLPRPPVPYRDGV